MTTRRAVSRTRILAGAHEILDNGVYGDLTVDALARSLSMSKSTLYKYFRGKDELVCAIVSAVCDAAESDLKQVAANERDPAKAIARICAILARHADDMPRAALLQIDRLPSLCRDQIEGTRGKIRVALEQQFARRGPGAVGAPLAATTLQASMRAAIAASAKGEYRHGRGNALRAAYGLLAPGLELPALPTLTGERHAR